MKIINKFKNYSREIKLIIITALIVSCVGVYAAGECIISATADDVTYENTTVQSAIDELYSMSQSCPAGYECKALNYVTDCNNKKVYSTVPNNLNGLAKIMAESAYLDNGKSEYVSSCSGLDFNDISSDTNGKGIYEIASTKNDTYPIYYYRGEVYNNNVKFAGFCWKAIRTTNTGGVKMIYNGEPDGSGNCTNTTGTNTQIGTSSFNSSYSSPADVGYMYGTRYTFLRKTSSDLAIPYIYGKDVTYSGGTYTLTNTMTSTGTWTTDYDALNNSHYTCFSTGTTCSSVFYIYYTTTSYAYYIALTNGKKVEDALDEMFDASDVNTTDSIVKTQIENWYNTNLSSHSSYIEDTIYCNDRSISKLNGWNSDGGDTTSNSISLLFSSYNRSISNSTPDLTCSRPQDSFSVTSAIGNGNSIYPIGLITNDEAIYAGGNGSVSNNTFYLYTNQDYWTLSPYIFGHYRAYELYVDSSGTINPANNVSIANGIRPVISLKDNDAISSGDGTSTNPYVISSS